MHNNNAQIQDNQLFIRLGLYNKICPTSQAHRHPKSNSHCIAYCTRTRRHLVSSDLERGILPTTFIFSTPLSELSLSLSPCGLSHRCPFILRDRVALCGVGYCSWDTCTMGIRLAFETVRRALSRSKSTTLIKN